MLSRPPSIHSPNPPVIRHATHLCAPSVHHPSPRATPYPLVAAEALLGTFGVESVEETSTEQRWREHRRGLQLQVVSRIAFVPLPSEPGRGSEDNSQTPLDQLPTGAVAQDVRGCIAAVTSTGRTHKMKQVHRTRVGDTPSMGAELEFWAEEWTITGWTRRVWRRVMGKSEQVAVGMSGRDVSGSHALGGS